MFSVCILVVKTLKVGSTHIPKRLTFAIRPLWNGGF